MCPWSQFEAGSVSFCEARLCAWVVEPSNAWSSLAYVAVGAWLLARAGSALLKQVAVAGVLIGLGSFAFHATGTFIGELIDLSGMLMLSGLMLSQAWGRLSDSSALLTGVRWAGLTLGALAVVLLIKPAGIALFAAELVSAIALELWLWRRGRTGQIRRFGLALSVVASAFVAWALDISRMVCAPDNHSFTGHALWHVLNAGAIAVLSSFYEVVAARPTQNPHEGARSAQRPVIG